MTAKGLICAGTFLGLALWPAAAAAAEIYTVAGAALNGVTRAGAPATDVRLAPFAVTPLPDGSFLAPDFEGHRVWKVSPGGRALPVAGTGQPGARGDGGVATRAQLNGPQEVALLAGGGFLIADAENNCIRRVDREGVITTAAGICEPGVAGGGFSGDGGPATQARLNLPLGVSVTPDGGFLIADDINARVRKVSSDGTISTVAGSGVEGYSGDGGPATLATLRTPARVSALPDGGFLIADRGNHAIRRVSADGTIATIAGGLDPERHTRIGDGGPAHRAVLAAPGSVSALPDGGYLIADTEHLRIRRVGPNGIIRTIAGSGRLARFPGDGGRPLQASLSLPIAAAYEADGSLLIADGSDHRVRIVPSRTSKRLLVAIRGEGRLRVLSGRRVRLPLTLSRPAALTVVLEGKGRRMVRRVRARAGRSRVSVFRVKLPGGRYRLRVVARSGRRVATDAEVLKVRA